MDVNSHQPAVDGTHLQMGDFCTACAGALQRHQHGARKGVVVGFDQARHINRSENLWQANHLLSIRVSAMLQLLFNTWI